jgi:hypothetical protein
MHRPTAPTVLVEPILRQPTRLKAAARFAAARHPLLRMSTRTVRKPRAAEASATIKISGTGDKQRIACVERVARMEQ